jgi:hypothetical protein
MEEIPEEKSPSELFSGKVAHGGIKSIPHEETKSLDLSKSFKWCPLDGIPVREHSKKEWELCRRAMAGLRY